jgi:hypothetical protein
MRVDESTIDQTRQRPSPHCRYAGSIRPIMEEEGGRPADQEDPQHALEGTEQPPLV